MDQFNKQLWMTARKQRDPVNHGVADCESTDVTGLVRIASRPVPLSERKPADGEKNESGQCYYGDWHQSTWYWIFSSIQPPWATHFLPAGVEVLPATCLSPNKS